MTIKWQNTYVTGGERDSENNFVPHVRVGNRWLIYQWLKELEKEMPKYPPP